MVRTTILKWVGVGSALILPALALAKPLHKTKLPPLVAGDSAMTTTPTTPTHTTLSKADRKFDKQLTSRKGFKTSTRKTSARKVGKFDGAWEGGASKLSTNTTTKTRKGKSLNASARKATKLTGGKGATRNSAHKTHRQTKTTATSTAIRPTQAVASPVGSM